MAASGCNGMDMTTYDLRWKKVWLRVENKDYQLLHKYSELLLLLEVDWLHEAKHTVINIKNLGKVMVVEPSFKGDEMVLHCDLIEI